MKAFTLAWSLSEVIAGACFADFTFPRGSTLEVGSLSAEGCGSTGSLSDIRGSITISTTKQPASPWTWFGLTSTKARQRADQTGENAFMSLAYHSTLSVD